MSALRDGGPTTRLGGGSYEVMDTTHTGLWRTSFWRRLWFVVSCIPRYLITGSVEVP